MVSQPDWVHAQHKTMTRWINSTLGLSIKDLTKDLADGLVLIKLINHVNAETDAVPYNLTPMYSKPTFKLQKIENLNDFLQFVKLVCKINICNIDADNIIDGNLKLILGLIWSIFIYSTSNSLIEKSQNNSLIEIKSILINWCNNIIHKRALPQLSNFNKDWSLEINRPDLTFAAILSFYLPDLINYNDFVLPGKTYQNLSNVLSVATDNLGIAALADVDDFNFLVPDEKCVIFYVLEWFKFFEMNSNDEVESLIEETELESIDNQNPIYFDEFFQTIVATIKLKHIYETKSLRLINQLNSNILKLTNSLEFINNQDLVPILSNNINIFLNTFNSNEELVAATTDNFNNIENNFNHLISILTEFDQYKTILKPEYIYNDFPELSKSLSSISVNLNLIGITQNYQPPKSLTLPSLLNKMDRLQDLETSLSLKLKSLIDQLDNWQDFNLHLTSLAQKLPECRNNNEKKLIICDYINRFEYLISVNHKLDFFNRTLELTKSPKELQKHLDSLNNPCHDCSPIKINFEDSQISQFKAVLPQDKLLNNLSFIDLNSLLKNFFQNQNDKNLFQSFIQLIPNRTLVLNRSESDFNIHYPSDESDDSNSLFDGLSKKVGGKLMGNYDKVYNLAEFIDKLENGFKI